MDINYNDGYDLETNQIVNLEQTLSEACEADVVIVAMGERALESGEMRSKGISLSLRSSKGWLANS